MISEQTSSCLVLCWALVFVGLFVQRYFEYEYHPDSISINQDTLIKFDRGDCPYSIPFISTLYIHLTVDKYSDADISLSFYRECDQGNYMGRQTGCFAAVRKTCLLEVPGNWSYLVARADDIKKMKDDVAGKFIWRCDTHHYSIDTLVRVVIVGFIFVVLPLTLCVNKLWESDNSRHNSHHDNSIRNISSKKEFSRRKREDS